MSRIEELRWELKVWREVQQAVASFVRGEVLYAENADFTRENRLATHIHDRIATLTAQINRERSKAQRHLEAAE